MRFTSLIVELIRSRPKLAVWVVLLVQAAIWLAIAMLLYGSPPGNVATLIAYGREYQVGTELGPPLPFWLADLSYRAAGNHLIGVYVLAQLCAIATLWILFLLGRALVGGPHAVVAVLLTMTVTVYGWPGIEFGPQILARPLWALTLLQTWRVIGEGRRSAWFGLAIAASLLMLTTADAPWLLLLVAVALIGAVRRNRRLISLDPVYAALVGVTLTLPWLVWLRRTDALRWPSPATGLSPSSLDLVALQDAAIKTAISLGLLAFSTIGIVLLAVMNSSRFARRRETPPSIFRAGITPIARRFVYTFALAPPLLGSALAAALGRVEVIGGAGAAMLMVGLAVVVGAGDAILLRRQRILRQVWALLVVVPAIIAIVSLLIVPQLARIAQASAIPASDVARYFGDSFQRRTGRPLTAVAGDPDIAALIALGPTRPRLLIDPPPGRGRWLTEQAFRTTGGVVVWRATDTAGAPPPEIARLLPDLVPEVPQVFDSVLNGRQPPPRIGWAIVRPPA